MSYSTTIVHKTPLNTMKPLSSLAPGDFFKYGGGLFIKTSPKLEALVVQKQDGGFARDAYKTTDFAFDDTLVTPVSVRIEVSP